jgi:hypothetical protein
MRSKPVKPESATSKNEPSFIVVPDLSYKKKEVEDLLIDTEAHFIENRYHFDKPKPTAPAIQEPAIYAPPVQPQQITQVTAQAYTPPYVPSSPSPPPSANLLSEMDGLLFLGVQPAPSPAKVETPSMSVPSVPVQQPTLIPQTNTMIPSPLAPIQVVLPQNQPPQFQLPTYNYSQISMNQPYPPLAALPTAYAPNYSTYYNPSIPYNNAIPNPYTSYGYQQRPYNPIITPNSPYLNQQQQYSAYQSPPINNYQPYPQSQPYSQSQSPISYPAPLPYSSPIEPKLTTAKPPAASKNEEDFGDFKNGGSFDIQKVILN